MVMLRRSCILVIHSPPGMFEDSAFIVSGFLFSELTSHWVVQLHRLTRLAQGIGRGTDHLYPQAV